MIRLWCYAQYYVVICLKKGYKSFKVLTEYRSNPVISLYLSICSGGSRGEAWGTLPSLVLVGSVGLCRHNFDGMYYIWCIRPNADIILIFLPHNALVSENYDKCMQIVPATHSRMYYKVDKGGNILGT